MNDLLIRDRITVERDGERLDVFNWANVTEHKTIWGGAQVETRRGDVGAGDSSAQPDAVTQWLADDLWSECLIDVEERGIEVVDVESEEVDVL